MSSSSPHIEFGKFGSGPTRLRHKCFRCFRKRYFSLLNSFSAPGVKGGKKYVCIDRDSCSHAIHKLGKK